MKELTEAQREEIRTGRPFSELLPVTARSGLTIESITVDCAACGEEIDDRLTRIHRHEPIPGVHLFQGYGCCVACRTATPILLRVMPDGRIEGPSPETGRWCSWNFGQPERRPPPWDLIGWWRRLLRA